MIAELPTADEVRRMVAAGRGLRPAPPVPERVPTAAHPYNRLFRACQDAAAVADDALAFVAQRSGVDEDLLRGRDRHEHVLFARWCAMWLTREATGANKFEVSRVFKKDHGTVGNAFKRLSERAELEGGVADDLRRLRDEFKAWQQRRRNEPA